MPNVIGAPVQSLYANAQKFLQRSSESHRVFVPSSPEDAYRRDDQDDAEQQLQCRCWHESNQESPCHRTNNRPYPHRRHRLGKVKPLIKDLEASVPHHPDGHRGQADQEAGRTGRLHVRSKGEQEGRNDQLPATPRRLLTSPIPKPNSSAATNRTARASGRKPGTSWGKNASTINPVPTTTSNTRMIRSNTCSEIRCTKAVPR